MKQVLVRQGGIAVEEVPAPLCGFGRVLVKTAFSCLSPGTEMAQVKAAQMPLWKRALKQKEHVRRVLDSIKSDGLTATIAKVRGKLGGGIPTGYSVSGVVVAVGDGVEGFDVGDRVACAGAGLANHAEWVEVPMNLCVRVPQEVSLEDAATVTLGAIALQGVRRLQPTLGETFLVVGLGALGLLTTQFLRAQGCRVIGADPDPRRRAQAQGMGAFLTFDPLQEEGTVLVNMHTAGVGADGAVITASGPSDAIVAGAFQATRRKGRVVLVGDVGLALKRADLYAKELDFLISCSYGPGRYDADYEEAGLDYPLPYVRWTENRNMQAYLELLREGRVRVAPLVEGTFPIAQAEAAYASLQTADRPALVLLTYPEATAPDPRRVVTPQPKPPGEAGFRVGLLGAGNFAQGMHLPLLKSLGGPWSLAAVMNRTGATARTVAAQYGIPFATTDPAEVLRDPGVDWVLISTRHNTHAGLVLQALEAGKHVFVEKPLCLTGAELEAIQAFYGAPEGAKPMLFTGYNRRFAPIAESLRRSLARRSGPAMLVYRMNAGFLPKDHWTQGAEGGGRNLGEACHIYDLFVSLLGQLPTRVEAQGIGHGRGRWSPTDNFTATFTFPDGSLATLHYTALGSKAFPKEHLEGYWDDTVAVMTDWRELAFHGSKEKGVRHLQPEKGHKEEWQALARAHREGAWAIPLDQQFAAAAMALAVETQIRS